MGDLVGHLDVAEQTDTQSLTIAVAQASCVVAARVGITLEVVFVDLVVLGLVVLTEHLRAFRI